MVLICTASIHLARYLRNRIGHIWQWTPLSRPLASQCHDSFAILVGGRACIRCLYCRYKTFHLRLPFPDCGPKCAQIHHLRHPSTELLLGHFFLINDATMQAYIILLESESARSLRQPTSHCKCIIHFLWCLHCHRFHPCHIAHLPCLEFEHESASQGCRGWNSWNGCNVSDFPFPHPTTSRTNNLPSASIATIVRIPSLKNFIDTKDFLCKSP